MSRLIILVLLLMFSLPILTLASEDKTRQEIIKISNQLEISLHRGKSKESDHYYQQLGELWQSLKPEDSGLLTGGLIKSARLFEDVGDLEKARQLYKMVLSKVLPDDQNDPLRSKCEAAIAQIDYKQGKISAVELQKKKDASLKSHMDEPADGPPPLNSYR